MQIPLPQATTMAMPALAAALLGALSPTHAATYKMLHAFQGGADGLYPEGKLTSDGNALYGTTDLGGGQCNCGTVYRLSENGTERVIHAFAGGSTDGAYPEGGLAELKGKLYGTTNGGGASGCQYSSDGLCGTVYEISTQGGIRVLYSFQANEGSTPSSDLIAAHGAVWGISYFSSAAFKTAPVGKTTVYNSSAVFLPTSALTSVGEVFYGTTRESSQYCQGIDTYCGTIYKMSRNGQSSKFYDFTGGADGRYPGGTLARWHQSIFGTISNDTDTGAIFKISPSGVEKTLHSFTGGMDGSGSNNGLLEFEGTLYGTTPQGGGTGCGGNGCGTIFSVTPGGAYKVMYRFTGGSDGQLPQGQLVAWRGALYGTTIYGGGTGCNGNGCGTVFRIRP